MRVFRNLTWVVVVLSLLMGDVSRVRTRGDEPTPADSGPPSSSLAQVREGVARSRARLRSLLVEYVSDGRPAGEDKSKTIFSRHTIAALGPLRLTDNIHWTTETPPELDLNHHKVYYTGESLNVYYPMLGFYETSRQNARKSFSLKARSPFYFECLAWSPEDDPTEPVRAGKRPFLLHETLAQDGLQVRRHRERVDGAWCDVVALAAEDTMWFDPAKNYALRRRECRSAGTSVLEAVFTLSDYREQAPGVWIPWDARRVLYDVTRTGSDGNSPIFSDAHGRVVRVVVNSLSKEFFDFNPPPGLLIRDEDTNEIRQIPGGLSFLDETIEMARQISAIKGSRVLETRSSSRTGYILLAVIAAFALLDVYGLWHVFKDLRNRQPTPPRRSSQPAGP
jgi:hypothetical protein